MSDRSRKQIDAVLEQVSSSRRQMLKQLLVGAGAITLALPSSGVAAEAWDEQPQGKGKGEGPRGKGKGDFPQGKGKGGFPGGKGKGKGPGGDR